MTRTCPDCRYPMVTECHHDVDIDLCRNCAGIWFDADELRRLVAADPIVLPALEARVFPRVTQQKVQASQRGSCPSCNGLLHVYHYQYDSPIELDACAGCGGFWVQEGELEKMQQWRDRDDTIDADDARRLALAHAALEHDRALRRAEGLRRLFSVLQQHKPLWWSDM